MKIITKQRLKKGGVILRKAALLSFMVVMAANSAYAQDAVVPKAEDGKRMRYSFEDISWEASFIGGWWYSMYSLYTSSGSRC